MREFHVNPAVISGLLILHVLICSWSWIIIGVSHQYDLCQAAILKPFYPSAWLVRKGVVDLITAWCKMCIEVLPENRMMLFISGTLRWVEIYLCFYGAFVLWETKEHCQESSPLLSDATAVALLCSVGPLLMSGLG